MFADSGGEIYLAALEKIGCGTNQRDRHFEGFFHIPPVPLNADEQFFSQVGFSALIFRRACLAHLQRNSMKSEASC